MSAFHHSVVSAGVAEWLELAADSSLLPMVEPGNHLTFKAVHECAVHGFARWRGGPRRRLGRRLRRGGRPVRAARA
jgi:hypothetical protein